MRTSWLSRTPASRYPGSGNRNVTAAPSSRALATGPTSGTSITRTSCLVYAGDDNSAWTEPAAGSGVRATAISPSCPALDYGHQGSWASTVPPTCSAISPTPCRTPLNTTTASPFGQKVHCSSASPSLADRVQLPLADGHTMTIPACSGPDRRCISSLPSSCGCDRGSLLPAEGRWRSTIVRDRPQANR
jgi:hypothetical protein